MTIRPLQPSDFELVCQHRESMFHDLGHSEEKIRSIREPFRAWLRPRIEAGDYFGFVMEDEGTPIGGLGLMILDWPPHISDPVMNLRGYVLNVYVEPAYRRQGLAKRLMERAEEELRARGIRQVSLHAGDAARSLYESLGWTATPEMSKTL